MSYIKMLDENTINKIAAGEVIERPASIIKELVENSIDAGADEISIEITGGGTASIRIIDNGKGIDKEELELAFYRHATSKIVDETDLEKITTLGFRGEALASIAAISKIEMISRLKDTDIGNKIYIEGGKLILREECGCPEGTVITVKDVFYNTPARLKFLKSESREGMYITDIVQNLAMSHTDISFKYRLNNKLILATKGDCDLKSVILAVYGKNIIKDIIDINCSRDFITIKGFIGNANISKNNRNDQSVFVNGRYIKNRTVTAAVEAAYKSMIMINKFPFFVLDIFISPEFTDVNVHPTKAEIKFQDEQIVFKSVYGCIRDTLADASGIIEIEDKREVSFESMPKVNYTQQEFDIGNTSIKTSADFTGNKATEVKSDSYEVRRQEFHREANHYDFTHVEQPVVRENITHDNRLPKFGPLAVVGQIHFTYIIAEGADEMYMIDQHAAHERVYYEKYLAEYNKSSIQSQNLIVPIIIELSISMKQDIIGNLELFKSLGYEIEDFGGNSIALRCVPLIYGNPNPKELFFEILSQIDLENKTDFNAISKVLYSMACKSAIKAGDKLNFREMSELIEQLRYCDNPFNCPHGRPTIVKMTYTELEKKFKRIQ